MDDACPTSLDHPCYSSRNSVNSSLTTTWKTFNLPFVWFTPPHYSLGIFLLCVCRPDSFACVDRIGSLTPFRALTPPGWKRTWHPCVRVKTTKKLVGFIAALPADVQIYDKTKKMVEINFLCVHKKLRAKRLAPVLIREITRRVHLLGLFQAFYTAGVMLPKPVSDCQYVA